MKTVIHAGYPKSASSSLQNLWEETADAFYPGKRPRWTRKRFMTKGLESLVREELPDPETFDFDKARRTVDVLREMAAKAGKDRLLISSENLSGLYFNRYGLRIASFATIVDRLHRLFGDELIFVSIIREQRAFLKSFHAQLLKQGYTLSFATFMEKTLGELEGCAIEDGPMPALRYDTCVAAIESAGLKSVWVPFEALVPDRTARQWLSEETGIGFDPRELPHINKTKAEQQLKRKLRRNAREDVSKFDEREAPAALAREAERMRERDFSKVDYTYRPEHEEKLRNYFAAGNARLKTDRFALADYGYMVT